MVRAIMLSIKQFNDAEPVLHRLCLWIGRVPPTSNNVRIHRARGGVAYSQEAMQFDAFVRLAVAPQSAIDISRFVATVDDTDMLDVYFTFYVHPFYNAGYWEKDRRGNLKRKGKSPYAVLDVTNRIKVVEDALSRLTGIDDHRTRHVSSSKLPATSEENAGVYIVVRKVPHDQINSPPVAEWHGFNARAGGPPG
jgi:hypothetical protein